MAPERKIRVLDKSRAPTCRRSPGAAQDATGLYQKCWRDAAAHSSPYSRLSLNLAYRMVIAGKSGCYPRPGLLKHRLSRGSSYLTQHQLGLPPPGACSSKHCPPTSSTAAPHGVPRLLGHCCPQLECWEAAAWAAQCQGCEHTHHTWTDSTPRISFSHTDWKR